MRKSTLSALPIVATLLLTGCSPLVVLSDRVEERFADATVFAEEADPMLQDGVVPADATAIDTVYHSDEPGSMLAYTSPTGPADCVPGPLTGEPEFESNWWPSTEPADGTVCGDWQVFAIDQRWYAWTS